MKVRGIVQGLVALAVVLAIVVAVTAGATHAITSTLDGIVHPRSDPPARTDVNFVLASSGGTRVVEAGQLATLPGRETVLSVPPELRALASYREACTKVAACIAPDPETTQGEARAIGRLARERGWRSVTVVTHRTHVSRSRVLVERCFPGEVRMQRVDVEGRLAIMVAFFYEVGASAKTYSSIGC